MGNQKKKLLSLLCTGVLMFCVATNNMFGMQGDNQKHVVLLLTGVGWPDNEYFDINEGIFFQKTAKKIKNGNKKIVGNVDFQRLCLCSKNKKNLEKLESAFLLANEISNLKNTYDQIHIIMSGNGPGPCILGLASQLLNPKVKNPQRVCELNPSCTKSRSKQSNSTKSKEIPVSQKDELFRVAFENAKNLTEKNSRPKSNHTISRRSKKISRGKEKVNVENLINQVIIIGNNTAQFLQDKTVVEKVNHLVQIGDTLANMDLHPNQQEHTIQAPEPKGCCAGCMSHTKGILTNPNFWKGAATITAQILALV